MKSSSPRSPEPVAAAAAAGTKCTFASSARPRTAARAQYVKQLRRNRAGRAVRTHGCHTLIARCACGMWRPNAGNRTRHTESECNFMAPDCLRGLLQLSDSGVCLCAHAYKSCAGQQQSAVAESNTRRALWGLCVRVCVWAGVFIFRPSKATEATTTTITHSLYRSILLYVLHGIVHIDWINKVNDSSPPPPAVSKRTQSAPTRPVSEFILAATAATAANCRPRRAVGTDIPYYYNVRMSAPAKCQRLGYVYMYIWRAWRARRLCPCICDTQNVLVPIHLYCNSLLIRWNERVGAGVHKHYTHLPVNRWQQRR